MVRSLADSQPSCGHYHPAAYSSPLMWARVILTAEDSIMNVCSAARLLGMLAAALLLTDCSDGSLPTDVMTTPAAPPESGPET